MTGFLTTIFGPVWAGRLVAVGAALVGILGAVGLIYRAGRKNAEADELRRTVEHAEEAADARREVDALPDGAAADELRRNWRR